MKYILRAGAVFATILVVTFVIPGRALAQGPYHAPQQYAWENLADLTRGHRLHILYGLQMSGWCGPEGPSAYNGVWDAGRWAESNLTTPSWNTGYAPDFLGSPPGDGNWGFWGGDILDPSRFIDEKDYLDTLTLVQYSDESKLDDQAVFNATAQMLANYRQNLPDAINFIDLHGSQVLQYGLITGELDDFLAQGRPDMVVMNDYLFNGTEDYVKGGTPYALWTSMAVLRKSCLAGYSGDGSDPIPAGQFIQTATHPEGLNSHIITESELNLYVFSSLAFGFKTMIAYRYADSASLSLGGIDTVLFSDPGYDHPTAAFYYFADAVDQANKLGPALVRLLSTDLRVVRGYYDNNGVKTAVPINAQTPLWSSSVDPYMTGITAQNLGTENSGYEGSVLVGYFKPLDESFDGPGYGDQAYFMVVNALSSDTAGEDATQQRITMTFDFGTSGITQLLRVNRSTGNVETVPLQHLSGTQYQLQLDLNGGLGDLFKYDTGAPFVGMNGPWTDADHDGLSDAFESASGTFANEYDTGTSASNPDCDNDGLTDGDEVNLYGTNPLLRDSDGDSVPDGFEVAAGLDPTNPDDASAVPVLAPTALALLALAAVAYGRRRVIQHH